MKLCILILLALAHPAFADDRADAEALFRIGADAYKAGKYEAAAENFDRAYELFKAPEIAFSAAQAHRQAYARGVGNKAAHVKRAVEMYEAYVAATPQGQGKRKDAEAHLETLRGALKSLEAAGEKVIVPVKQTPSIYVSVALDNAVITVDGKAAERYTPVDVEPGEHTVDVSAEGYQPLQRKVTVTKGQAIVPVELIAKPAHVSITTRADAKITVDGRPVSTTRSGTAVATNANATNAPSGASTLEIAAGKRLIAVYARGREPVVRELDLKPGQELSLDVPLRMTARRRAAPWVWIGAGTLLVGTLVTTVVATTASFSAADLRDSPDPLVRAEADRYERLRDRRDTYRTASLVLGTAALATAATALWLYYFDLPSSDDLARPVETRTSGFAPLALSSGAGLSFGGVFR